MGKANRFLQPTRSLYTRFKHFFKARWNMPVGDTDDIRRIPSGKDQSEQDL